MKKKILGASDAWLTSRLSHQPRKPAYYIVDCRIFALHSQYPELLSLLVLEPSAAAAGHRAAGLRHAAGRRHAAKPMQPKLVPGLDDDDGLTRPGAKRVRLWRDRTPEGAFPPSCLLLLPTVVPND